MVLLYDWKIMRTYLSQQPAGFIRSVAFEKTGDGQYCFVTTADAASTKRVQALLAEANSGQQVISVTESKEGQLLVLRGGTPERTLKLLATDGQQFALPEVQKKFNPWAWRGILSIVGQSGQLLSGGLVYKHAKKIFEESAKLEADQKLLGDKRNDSFAIGVFALLNLCANVINITFGAQKKNDPHQLAYLKQQFNEHLQTEYGVNAAVDAPNTTLVAGKEKAGSFLQQHSVSFGEVFLRTLGSVSLAFPVTQVKAALKALRTGGIKEGFAAAKNKTPATFWYGIAMLTGKFTSFMATESDPYNPEPPSAWRSFREKVAFRLSSVIEGGGALYSVRDRYKNHEIFVGNKSMPDIPGTFGNAVFVAGYGIRYTAPYGSREVYMPELYAHVSKALAQLPVDRQAEALAKAAQWMAGHFADKKQENYRLPAMYAELTKELKAQPAKSAPVSAKEASHVPLADAPSTKIGNIQSRDMLQQPAAQHGVTAA